MLKSLVFIWLFPCTVIATWNFGLRRREMPLERECVTFFARYGYRSMDAIDNFCKSLDVHQPPQHRDQIWATVRDILHASPETLSPDDGLPTVFALAQDIGQFPIAGRCLAQMIRHGVSVDSREVLKVCRRCTTTDRLFAIVGYLRERLRITLAGATREALQVYPQDMEVALQYGFGDTPVQYAVQIQKTTEPLSDTVLLQLATFRSPHAVSKDLDYRTQCLQQMAEYQLDRPLVVALDISMLCNSKFAVQGVKDYLQATFKQATVYNGELRSFARSSDRYDMQLKFRMMAPMWNQRQRPDLSEVMEAASRLLHALPGSKGYVIQPKWGRANPPYLCVVDFLQQGYLVDHVEYVNLCEESCRSSASCAILKSLLSDSASNVWANVEVMDVMRTPVPPRHISGTTIFPRHTRSHSESTDDSATASSTRDSNSNTNAMDVDGNQFTSGDTLDGHTLVTDASVPKVVRRFRNIIKCLTSNPFFEQCLSRFPDVRKPQMVSACSSVRTQAVWKSVASLVDNHQRHGFSTTSEHVLAVLALTSKDQQDCFHSLVSRQTFISGKFLRSCQSGNEDLGAIDFQCPICLEEVTDPRDLHEWDGCFHSFHRACVKSWSGNCPYCRRPSLN